MISRRNIRVKVMQALYAAESMETEWSKDEIIKALFKSFDTSRSLFIYLIHVVTEVALYVELDARQRASKHLPTAEDLHLNTKLAENQVLQRILSNESYKKMLKIDKPELIDSEEWIKKLYHQLVQSDEYKAYLNIKQRDFKSEKKMMEFIFQQLMMGNEDFDSFLEEQFLNWQDDDAMMEQLMMNFLNKPAAFDFTLFISQEKLHFGKTLLTTYFDKTDQCMELIKPKLQNWDPERTALLDMILMKMGICELLFFETIPTKVTLNEYIDIAKEYSTAQSGHFVNGILDSIHKDLMAENKIHKVNFKTAR